MALCFSISGDSMSPSGGCLGPLGVTVGQDELGAALALPGLSVSGTKLRRQLRA